MQTTLVELVNRRGDISLPKVRLVSIDLRGWQACYSLKEL